METLKYIWERVYEASGIASFSWWNALIFLAVVVGVFVIEMLAVGWQRSSLRIILKFEKSARTDLYFWLTEIFGIYNLIALVLSFGICYYLTAKIQTHVDLQFLSRIDNGMIQFAIFYIISDFKEYIKHFLFHKIRPLWELHSMHHSADKLTILTATRFHFLESALGTFFNILPLVLLGAPIQTFFAISILGMVHGFMVHSNMEHDWGFIGKYIIVSPAAHRIHHSAEKRHYDKNFGGMFIFWDRLFGTYHPAEKVAVIGIPNNPYNKKGFAYDIIAPIGRMFGIRKKHTQ